KIVRDEVRKGMLVISFWKKNKRRIVGNPGFAGLHGRELRKVMLNRIAVGFFCQTSLDPFLVHSVVNQVNQILDVDTSVPPFERQHLRKFIDVLAISRHTLKGGIFGILFRKFVVAPRDYKASRESFHIPFPGSRQCFIEIVDVEDDAPFGSSKSSEVHQMAISTGLDSNSGSWCMR